MDGKFRPFDEFLSSRLSNIPYTCPQYSFDGKVFFEQNICILRYSYRKRTILAFRWIFLAGLSKLHSWCREEHFEEKIILGKNYKSFSSFFYTARKVFGLLAKLFWQIFVWTALYMSIKTFWEKKNQNFKSFFVFGDFERNFFSGRFSGGIVKPGFYVSVGKSWSKWSFFENFLKTSLDMEQRHVGFLSILSQRCCQYCKIPVHKNIFRTKVCEKFIFSFVGLRHWLSFLYFCFFPLNWVVKIVCYLSVGVFWGKRIRKKKIFSSFSVNERKKIGLFSNSFQREFQNCFHSVDKKILRKKTLG